MPLTPAQIDALRTLRDGGKLGCDPGAILPWWAWWISSAPTLRDAGAEVVALADERDQLQERLEAMLEPVEGVDLTELVEDVRRLEEALVVPPAERTAEQRRDKDILTVRIARQVPSVVRALIVERDTSARVQDAFANLTDVLDARCVIDTPARPPLAWLAACATLTARINSVPGAKNFLQEGWTWKNDDGTETTYKVLVQRGEGKTPADVCNELDAERSALIARLEAVRNALGKDAPSIADPPSVWSVRVGHFALGSKVVDAAQEIVDEHRGAKTALLDAISPTRPKAADDSISISHAVEEVLAALANTTEERDELRLTLAAEQRKPEGATSPRWRTDGMTWRAATPDGGEDKVELHAYLNGDGTARHAWGRIYTDRFGFEKDLGQVENARAGMRLADDALAQG